MLCLTLWESAVHGMRAPHLYCAEIASHGSWRYYASFVTQLPKTQHRGKEARNDFCDPSRPRSLHSKLQIRTSETWKQSLKVWFCLMSAFFSLKCRNSIMPPGGAQTTHLAEALGWRIRSCQVLVTFVSNQKTSGTPSPSGHADLPPALVRVPSLPRECGWTQVTLLGDRRGSGTWGLI